MWRASLVAQMVKNLPAMQETWVQSLGLEDPRKKERATHSNILSWWILWTVEPGGLPSMGLQRVGHDWVTKHMHVWRERYGIWLFLGETQHHHWDLGVISYPSLQTDPGRGVVPLWRQRIIVVWNSQCLMLVLYLMSERVGSFSKCLCYPNDK